MPDLLASLRKAFVGQLLTDPDDVEPFVTDWRRQWRGTALAVALPASTAEVAQLVGWCRENGVPVVPQGGNTGLSGGATPDASGRALVLSLKRLNKIRAIDTVNNTMTVEAGCILAAVQQAADAAGRLFPLSLAAEGSCTIGGNLSTNAGGTAVLRYGNARDLCLGVEVVTASGEIWDGLRQLRKDNTGYDLRGLFIGAEGTLGVITAAVLKLFPRPAGRAAAFVALAAPDAALTLLGRAQQRLNASLTAFELISDTCLGLVLHHFPAMRSPLAGRSPWYVLIEVAGAEAETENAAALEALLAEALESEVIEDAALASSIAQLHSFWAIRENIPEAQSRAGAAIKHDISVPISRTPSFVTEASGALKQHFPANRLVVFGHVGDGNLHFNLSPPEGQNGAAMLEDQSAINRLIHDCVARYGGSISAEHGLGVLRRDEAVRYKPAVEFEIMRAIKRALDPDGLMNPGKLLNV